MCEGDFREEENNKLNIARHAFSCSMRYVGGGMVVLFFNKCFESYCWCWFDGSATKQVPRHEDRMDGPLASLSVEWCVHYDVLRCGVVEGWPRRSSSEKEHLPNSERANDNEEEAAEYRRHD